MELNSISENSVTAIDGKRVTLKTGDTLDADLVVIGVGVRPRVALAEKAGLATDKGVSVTEYMETSAPDIYAAGDIARWPERDLWRTHPRRALGGRRTTGADCSAQHHGDSHAIQIGSVLLEPTLDVPINYVGHAEKWDAIDIEGDVMKRDCVARYKLGGRVMAVASIYRDKDSLEAGLEMEEQAGKAKGAR